MAYEDLLKDTSAVAPDDNNKFIVTILDLDLNKTYPIQFRWKYKDGTFGKWSTSKLLTTPGESFPDTPGFSQTDVVGGPEYIKVTWGGLNASGNAFTNYDRIDVYISGSPFDGSKPAASFKTPGTQILKAPQGEYLVALYAVSVAGTRSAVSADFSAIVTAQGETIENPTNPNGFSIDRILSGIKVNWAGTYANGTFTGFEAIKIYVGTSATATAGTYVEVGVMTGNNVKNAIVIPVDGTYLRYNLPVYVHAAAVNKSGTVGTLQANVANNSLGARSAIGSDLDDLIITNTKLVDDAVSAAKILTGAITTTKIADDAITSAKIIANAITADKITAGAIVADKIATNAITAGKILAGTIDVSKLAAGTISVNNLEAGSINATSFIRAGVAGAGRVELSSAAISGGPAAGLYIYNSAGTAVLSAPLGGGLTITGGGTFTGDLSVGSGASKFGSDSNGIWLGSDTYSLNSTFRVSRSGYMTANSGTVGGWSLTDSYMQNGSGTFKISSADSAVYVGNSASTHLRISASGGIATYNGGSQVAGFSLTTGGTLILAGEITAKTGYIGDPATNNAWIIGSDGITSTGAAKIKVGDYIIKSDAGTDFTLTATNGLNLMKTESLAGATDSPNRLYLGSGSRQVEVAKPAQISGNGTSFVDGYNQTATNAYRSGGLRNMYTVSKTNLVSGIFPSAANGDVLLVYDSTVGI
jgi:hypothetical protein